LVASSSQESASRKVVTGRGDTVSLRYRTGDPDPTTMASDLLEDGHGVGTFRNGPARGDRHGLAPPKEARVRLLGKDLADEAELGGASPCRGFRVLTPKGVAIPRRPREPWDGRRCPYVRGKDPTERRFDPHRLDAIDRSDRGEETAAGHVDQRQPTEGMHLHAARLPLSLDPPSRASRTGGEARNERLAGEPRGVEPARNESPAPTNVRTRVGRAARTWTVPVREKAVAPDRPSVRITSGTNSSRTSGRSPP